MTTFSNVNLADILAAVAKETDAATNEAVKNRVRSIMFERVNMSIKRERLLCDAPVKRR